MSESSFGPYVSHLAASGLHGFMSTTSCNAPSAPNQRAVSGNNVFFIQNGVIHTPAADRFLNGITRQTVIELARRRGYEVVERRIRPEEMAGFSECFITGSAAEVTPVSEIAQYRFTPAAMTKTLMDDYTAEVQPRAKAA